MAPSLLREPGPEPVFLGLRVVLLPLGDGIMIFAIGEDEVRSRSDSSEGTDNSRAVAALELRGKSGFNYRKFISPGQCTLVSRDSFSIYVEECSVCLSSINL